MKALGFLITTLMVFGTKLSLANDGCSDSLSGKHLSSSFSEKISNEDLSYLKTKITEAIKEPKLTYLGDLQHTNVSKVNVKNLSQLRNQFASHKTSGQSGTLIERIKDTFSKNEDLGVVVKLNAGGMFLLVSHDSKTGDQRWLDLITGKLWGTPKMNSSEFYSSPESQMSLPTLDDLRLVTEHGLLEFQPTFLSRMATLTGYSDGVVQLSYRRLMAMNYDNTLAGVFLPDTMSAYQRKWYPEQDAFISYTQTPLTISVIENRQSDVLKLKGMDGGIFEVETNKPIVKVFDLHKLEGEVVYSSGVLSDEMNFEKLNSVISSGQFPFLKFEFKFDHPPMYGVARTPVFDESLSGDFEADSDTYNIRPMNRIHLAAIKKVTLLRMPEKVNLRSLADLNQFQAGDWVLPQPATELENAKVLLDSPENNIKWGKTWDWMLKSYIRGTQRYHQTIYDSARLNLGRDTVYRYAKGEIVNPDQLQPGDKVIVEDIAGVSIFGTFQ